MDFNYLYFRQQVSLVRAARAACGVSRAAHEGLARLYGTLIDEGKAQRAPGKGQDAAIPGMWL